MRVGHARHPRRRPPRARAVLCESGLETQRQAHGRVGTASCAACRVGRAARLPHRRSTGELAWRSSLPAAPAAHGRHEHCRQDSWRHMRHHRERQRWLAHCARRRDARCEEGCVHEEAQASVRARRRAAFSIAIAGLQCVKGKCAMCASSMMLTAPQRCVVSWCE